MYLFEIYDMKVWTGFMWHLIGTSGLHSNEPLSCTEHGHFVDQQK
jgi:hypothetical protein